MSPEEMKALFARLKAQRAERKRLGLPAVKKKPYEGSALQAYNLAKKAAKP